MSRAAISLPVNDSISSCLVGGAQVYLSTHVNNTVNPRSSKMLVDAQRSANVAAGVANVVAVESRVRRLADQHLHAMSHWHSMSELREDSCC